MHAWICVNVSPHTNGVGQPAYRQTQNLLVVAQDMAESENILRLAV